MRSFTQIDDLTAEEISCLKDLAKNIKARPDRYAHALAGKILGLMFFEPSTRTYFSFASAMQRLGGTVMGFNGIEWTSMTKGESLEDTARMMASYADVLVCRTKEVGTATHLQKFVKVPVINAGEGDGEHPTQALTDLFTIDEHFGRSDINLCLYGDLRFGRTTHSLIKLAARMGANITCVAPEAFQMPLEYIHYAQDQGATVTALDKFDDATLQAIDVLYVTRIQRERLPENTDMDVFDGGYVIDAVFAKRLSPTCIVMHPLPRVNEITTDFDADPRAMYFQQAANGVPVRAALLQWLLRS